MTEPVPPEPGAAREPDAGPLLSDRPGPPDYGGAIYGSLLAASTVLGTATSGGGKIGSAALLAALIVTSLVFFLLHVYARAIGRELGEHTTIGMAVGQAAREEFPILLAVVPPAAAVLVMALLLEEPSEQIGWAALWAAVGGQVFWTWLAVRRVTSRLGVLLLSVVVSTVLGLALVGFKLAIAH